MTDGTMRKVAILDPVADSGIGSYTHELAQGLTAAGARVDLYSSRRSFSLGVPRSYRLLPVLGRPLSAQRAEVEEAERTGPHGPAWHPAPAPASEAWKALPRAEQEDRTGEELADHLLARGYDAVWTQWPQLAGGEVLRERLRAAGARLVHTVHNVFPHERFAGDAEIYGAAYRDADALVVHSEATGRVLEEAFPDTRGRVVRSRHGTYSLYPRRPELRAPARERLGIPDGTPAALFFGGVRPYKNVDAVLEGMADPRGRDWVLVVAGCEWGYPDMVAGDMLGRTRRLAERLGVADRVRLLPGSFGFHETAELFEAADAVVLPYVESYGSGVLCLAMTFGRQVLATAAGGMDEYLALYPRSTLLAGPSGDAMADGLARAAADVRARPAPCVPPPELAWERVARDLLPRLAPAPAVPAAAAG